MLKCGMNSLPIVVFVVLCLASGIHAQFGVKTQQRVQFPVAAEMNDANSTDCNFGFGCIGVGSQTHPQQKFNATGEFLNQTLSKQPSGICFKEVPTASLVQQSGYIPAGNGSNPSLSRVQVCCEGYERNIHNFYKCEPICEKECVNGLCFAPNQCRCYPDHILNLAGACTATCPIGCANGDCQPDNSCLCKTGYVLGPNNKYCIPLCRQDCTHGTCTGPDVCECKEGYHTINENGACVPQCRDGCANGDCVAPDECTCHTGYVKTNGVCQPVCSRGCDGGICVRPDTCECNPGFTPDATGAKCVAHCEPACLNGECVGANKCSCRPGYVLDEFSENRCIPHCPNGCRNGICSGPNFCVCSPGFVKDRSVKGSQVCVPRAK